MLHETIPSASCSKCLEKGDTSTPESCPFPDSNHEDWLFADTDNALSAPEITYSVKTQEGDGPPAVETALGICYY